MTTKSVIYNNKITKNPISTFFRYLRDCLFFYLPFKRIPNFIRTLVFGDIDYVFFIHPRRTEDFYLGLPFFFLLRKIFSKKFVFKLASKLPPVIVSSVKNENGNGIVLSSLILPEMLLTNHKEALRSALKAVKFARRISKDNCCVGLGAWWPIVTQRGLFLKKTINDDKVKITNGHTGTLISINLMIEHIARISNIKMIDFKVAIIGTGKMGANVAKVLLGRVNTLCLVDINAKSIEKLYEDLKKQHNSKTKIEKYIKNEKGNMQTVLDEYHIGVCVTSNTRIAIKPNEIPDHFILIDDSRPEAVSRNINSDKVIVIEGGLMKIVNTTNDYDFGFGIDQNVFGCLAETYALSLDKEGILKTTLGDVDLNNYANMKYFCHSNGIEVGDFKTGNTIISNTKITDFINQRHKLIFSKQKTRDLILA